MCYRYIKQASLLGIRMKQCFVLFFSPQQLFKLCLVGKVSPLPLEENSHGPITFQSILGNKMSCGLIIMQSQYSHQIYLVLKF